MLKGSDKYLLIVNPLSGNGKAIDMLPEVDGIMSGMGVKCDIQISENPAQATATAASAASLGYGRVIALGGDGAVNAVAAGLTNSEVILGVIPGGRGNDFCRSLGITGNLAQICKLAIRGEAKLIDVGMLNDKLFINSSGFGFAAIVASEANHITGNGKFAYYRAIYRAWKNYAAYDLSLRIDNIEIKMATTMVSVGLGKSTGGWPITPQALNDDGKFDVCVVEKVKRSKIFPLLLKFSRGDHLRLPEVRMYRCRQIEISGYKSLPAHYDGEIYQHDSDRFMVKIEPAVLRVAANLEGGNEA
jgi:diacylglycerol kinase (ATP)